MGVSYRPVIFSRTSTKINTRECSFAGYAQWSPRAWHGATVFKNTVWVVGGTPITNDVWFMSDITYFDYRRPPLTRAMYLDYRYEVQWTKAGEVRT